MSESEIKVGYGIFCDDIRREDTGKYLFIGVYTDDLIVPAFPMPGRLAFFINGKHHGIGKIPFRLRVLFMPGELTFFQMKADAVSANQSKGFAVFNLCFGFSFQAQREGYLSLQFGQHNKDWEEIQQLKIYLEDQSSPNVPSQPS